MYGDVGGCGVVGGVDEFVKLLNVFNNVVRAYVRMNLWEFPDDVLNFTCEVEPKVVVNCPIRMRTSGRASSFPFFNEYLKFLCCKRLWDAGISITKRVSVLSSQLCASKRVVPRRRISVASSREPL